MTGVTHIGEVRLGHQRHRISSICLLGNPRCFLESRIPDHQRHYDREESYLRFGTHIEFNRVNEWLRPLQDFYFPSFSALENDEPFALQKIGFPNFIGVRNSKWDLYAEDTCASRRLTFNFGPASRQAKKCRRWRSPPSQR